MKFLKSMSIYTISNLSQKAIGFVLLPIITAYLSTEQNGDLSLIMSSVAMLGPLLLLSAHGAINVEYFRQDQGKKNFSTYLSSAIVNPFLAFGLSLFLAILFTVFFGDWISTKLEIDKIWIILIPAFALSTVLPQIISVIYQIKDQPVNYAVYNVSQMAVDLGMSILFIVALSWNWEGRVWGKYMTMIIYSFISIFLLYRSGLLNFKIKKEYVRDAFIFGLPLIPHVLSGGIMDLSDRLFIRVMISKEELGIYDIGYKIGSIILIIQASVVMAWTPYVFGQLKEITKAQKINICRMSYLIVIGLFIAAFGLSLISPLLFKYFVMQEAYHEGVKYVGVIALAYVLLGCYKMFSIYIVYLKKNIYLSYIAVFNILANLLLNYLLIPKYGAMGAAYATLISYFLFFVITAIISQWLYPLPWIKAIINKK